MAFKLQVLLLAVVVVATIVEGAVVKHRRSVAALKAFPGDKFFWTRNGRFEGALIPPKAAATDADYMFFVSGEDPNSMANWHFSLYGFGPAYSAVAYKSGASACYAQMLGDVKLAGLQALLEANDGQDLNDGGRKDVNLQCTPDPVDEDLKAQAFAIFPYLAKICGSVDIFICQAAPGGNPSSARLSVNGLNQVIYIF